MVFFFLLLFDVVDGISNNLFGIRFVRFIFVSICWSRCNENFLLISLMSNVYCVYVGVLSFNWKIIWKFTICEICKKSESLPFVKLISLEVPKFCEGWNLQNLIPAEFNPIKVIKRQSCHHIETSQLICFANQSIDLLCKSIDWFLYDDNFGI